ncbi:hypothetical protein [Aromatoleum anaerobium]|uniref:Secreted protein n=1 Tax=Aromatoleum anaerobium TaxID=182180 RepID=A0ABX1PMX2_9RHOO|nr:hypothetical protein [Aromatoleum anaerobium]MCK0505849.1 hypothetical protein [Aromatoleum anaerobium]
MKNMAFLAVIFTSSGALAAGGGPTSIGAISIGMSKQEYISTIGITPIDCNTLRDNKGQVIRSELKYLTPDRKTLCFDGRFGNSTGTVENIQIGGLAYDVVEANYESSKIVASIGNSSKTIFLKDRLISIEIYSPNVGLETLTTKYGPPRLDDITKIETCKNRMGNEFNNRVGKIDAVWTNGDVSAILRKELNPPRKTCSDGLDMLYYIIEERKQLELIETAINNFRKEVAKTTAKDSPF